VPKVYLPAGRWIKYSEKRTVYDGKATITTAAALGTIPLFVREGAILPRGDIIKLNNDWEANWKPRLRIEAFPARNMSSEFHYFTGAGTRTIKMARVGDGITMSFDDLGVNGAFEVYCGTVTAVKRNGSTLREGTDYQYETQAQKLTIPFSGRQDARGKGRGEFVLVGNEHAARYRSPVMRDPAGTEVKKWIGLAGQPRRTCARFL
jgi:alpha-glucosidase (family GH31 glycosyl hydrolase)